MRRIGFEVRGELPPKKDGANSMWGKPKEAKRLIALREAALKAIESKKSLEGNVRLTLKVYFRIPEWDTLDRDARYEALKKRGDLDNFVSGVCDGLMGLGKYPHPSQTLAPVFQDAENEAVHPLRAIAYQDDSQVREICARSIVNAGNDGYTVELQEVEPE